jgi:hypothetical protein
MCKLNGYEKYYSEKPVENNIPVCVYNKIFSFNTFSSQQIIN